VPGTVWALNPHAGQFTFHQRFAVLAHPVAHRAILAVLQRVDVPLEKAERGIKATMAAWTIEQERIRRAEEDRLRLEQEKAREAELEAEDAAGGGIVTLATIDLAQGFAGLTFDRDGDRLFRRPRRPEVRPQPAAPPGDPGQRQGQRHVAG
jgi:hypothetical protein